MMLTDTFGWMKRNIRTMSEVELKKTLKEVEQIDRLIKNNLKMKGVI